ncbi:MAG TPA: PEP/pyruvate-binding domain-containing protein [Verrucomicrobiae bacterium]|nr:PEP/pyruvate-binding domain-containing protein [Verrucomicrobiae bacterium]
MRGTKAQNLQVLQDLGLTVPDFYELEAATLQKLDDPKVAAQVTTTFQAWCAEHHCQTVAVRSSAEGEDSVDQSFAGQYASVMEVTGKAAFLKALRTVANSQPSTAYTAKKHHKVHAIVQRYIAPDTAGVLFTVNPANGRAEMLINAVTGHGSKAVDGDDVEAIHIDRLSGDIRSMSQQPRIFRGQILQLQELGKRIENHFQSPQDIEWAFAGGTLYALQARPITRIAHVQVWDNANIGESFPGIVLPLTFSISRRGYELVYKSQSYAAGLDWYQLEGNHRTFSAMVGLYGGRMYYNLANWYKFIGLFPNNSQNQKYLDEQLQTIGDAAYLPPSSYPLGYRLKFFVRVARRSLFFEREKKRYWRYLDSTYAQYQTLPIGADLFTLLQRYTYIEQTVIPHMGRAADNDFFVMIYHGMLKGRLQRWLGADSQHATAFLGSLHDVISARQANILTDLAQAINTDPQAQKLLGQDNYEELDAYLLSTDTKTLLQEYRSQFLHRFAEDQKIEAKNPLLPLAGFYSLVRAYQQLDTTATDKRQHNALEAEQQRSQAIKKQLRPGQRLIYAILLRRLKHHLRIREHNRLLRGKAYAYLRELFIHVGQSLQAQGLVKNTDDVYYLDIEELFRLINGTGYQDDLQQQIAARRSRYKTYEKLKAPSRFITTGLTNTLPPEFADHQPLSGKAAKTLPGTICSPGSVTGKVIVLDKPIIPTEPFDILVVSHTDPGWTPLIALAKGLVVEHGGILSHAAIVTRELGIPSIIGVKDATRHLKTGTTVSINAAKGAVEIL